MTTWRSYFNDHIDMKCEAALTEIKRDGMRAMMQIDDIVVRYKNQDVFRRRSEGQKRRFQRIRQGE